MPEPRKGREGSRWINERPTGDDFANWFKTVPIHDGLNPEDYISGVTLIQQKEKGLENIGFDPNGQPQLVEAQNLVYIPYAKVDTRVAYFWDYMKLNPEWLGLIEPVTYAGQTAHNYNLPPGFFAFQQSHGEKKTNYVGCSMRVRILDASTAEYRDITETGPDGKMVKRRVMEGKVVFQGAPGTKISATASRYDADHFSMMKAETGAVGRALGMAGMLVIPGSGVATAEDMQEAQSTGTQPGNASVPASSVELPTGVADRENDPAFLRQRVAELLTTLDRDHKDALQQFQAWARDRGFQSVDALTDVQVKGVVKKLERVLDEAQRSAAPALVGVEPVDGPPKSQGGPRKD